MDMTPCDTFPWEADVHCSIMMTIKVILWNSQENIKQNGVINGHEFFTIGHCKWKRPNRPAIMHYGFHHLRLIGTSVAFLYAVWDSSKWIFLTEKLFPILVCLDQKDQLAHVCITSRFRFTVEVPFLCFIFGKDI